MHPELQPSSSPNSTSPTCTEPPTTTASCTPPPPPPASHAAPHPATPPPRQSRSCTGSAAAWLKRTRCSGALTQGGQPQAHKRSRPDWQQRYRLRRQPAAPVSSIDGRPMRGHRLTLAELGRASQAAALVGQEDPDRSAVNRGDCGLRAAACGVRLRRLGSSCSPGGTGGTIAVPDRRRCLRLRPVAGLHRHLGNWTTCGCWWTAGPGMQCVGRRAPAQARRRWGRCYDRVGCGFAARCGQRRGLPAG